MKKNANIVKQIEQLRNSGALVDGKLTICNQNYLNLELFRQSLFNVTALAISELVSSDDRLTLQNGLQDIQNLMEFGGQIKLTSEAELLCELGTWDSNEQTNLIAV